jgi:radial spoke head protein 9
MLTPANNETREFAQMCQGRFTGDPSHDFEVTKYSTTNEDTEEENIEEFKVNISKNFDEIRIFLQSLLREEERLAATLANIEQDALIIPRGAYVLQPNGDVERNRTFEG